MNLGIKNKNALITGGASGIGKAIVQDLVKEGVKVAVTSRYQSKVDEFLECIGGEKEGHYGIVSNLTEEGAPEKLIQEIHQNFGNIDIVVNNAGSTLDIKDPYCSIKDWRRIFRLNFEIAVELNNFLIPYMKEKDWGRIINITSGAGLENSGPVTYCASKAALTSYTRSMGRVLATETTNVVMSALIPGVIVTTGGYWEKVLNKNPKHAEKYLAERCPLKRFGNTSEVSCMVVFLASEKASFCQGALIPVDGGQAKHYFCT